MTAPLAERFREKYIPEPNTGCFIWTGAKLTTGYGSIRADGHGLTLRAHRVAYELAKGKIPDGLVIDHLCRVRLCVNAEHLRVVTNRVNTIENSDSFAAHNAAKTTCSKCGGKYTQGPKQRYCTPCKTKDKQRYRARL